MRAAKHLLDGRFVILTTGPGIAVSAYVSYFRILDGDCQQGLSLKRRDPSRAVKERLPVEKARIKHYNTGEVGARFRHRGAAL
jgi:hypothetical protein